MNTLELIKQKYAINSDKKVIEIPNVDRVDLASLFEELEFKTGAEIGTLAGEYAETLFQNNKHLEKLYCVDPYESYPGYREHLGEGELPDYYSKAIDRLENYPVAFIKEYSPQAADNFKKNSLDFVYIDANHALQAVINDICAWYPKVKHGGIISGHDYLKHKNSRGLHVVQAVNAFIDSYEKTQPLFILGSKKSQPGEKRDRFRSWFFIKP